MISGDGSTGKVLLLHPPKTRVIIRHAFHFAKEAFQSTNAG
jgi:hypothetical protein